MDRRKGINERLRELEDFKRKVEMGSWWLKCICYTVGSLIITAAALLEAIKNWPFK